MNHVTRSLHIEYMDGKVEDARIEYCDWRDGVMTVIPTDADIMYIPLANIRKFSIDSTLLQEQPEAHEVASA